RHLQVQLALVVAGDLNRFEGLVVAFEEGDLIGLDLEGLGDEVDDGLVGLAFFGAAGDLDGDAVAAHADELVLVGEGDDLNVEHGRAHTAGARAPTAAAAG